ncbi:MAG: M18 family aminopeptidase [Desulfamplus sp.]|nr:M18 family aminopeptidase [Desulfamplus sp.]
MYCDKYNEELFSFIKNSPTQYHAVANMARSLSNGGFVELREHDSWSIKPHSKYFATRNGSSIIAFLTGDNCPWESGIKLVGAHTDSPCLKVKPTPEIQSHEMVRLGVEVYGGALLNSWFDRGLNLAGRVTVLVTDEDNDKDNIVNISGVGEYGKEFIRTLLVNYDTAVATIPSLAIHLDREANTKRVLNPQIDMPPLFTIYSHSHLEDLENGSIQQESNDFIREPDSFSNSSTSKSFRLMLLEQVIKENSNINIKELLDFDMSFSDAQPPFFTGVNQDIISAPRLDNLLSCHVALKSILRVYSDNASVDFTSTQGGFAPPCMVVCTDHEEVGSDTAAGAKGSFFNSVLSRLIPDTEQRVRSAARSFMISLDNAHAVHPAHSELYDSSHTPVLNQGPVLKTNSSQRYASDCESAALFRYICKRADIPMQTFVMRSDMPCGSTIGPIISSSTGIKTVDAGAPTLAMHSIREITGSADPFMLFQVINHFFSMESLPLLSLI